MPHGTPVARQPFIVDQGSYLPAIKSASSHQQHSTSLHYKVKEAQQIQTNTQVSISNFVSSMKMIIKHNQEFATLQTHLENETVVIVVKANSH